METARFAMLVNIPMRMAVPLAKTATGVSIRSPVHQSAWAVLSENIPMRMALALAQSVPAGSSVM